MEVFLASVVLIVRALVISARWAGRQRRITLERMTAAAEASRIAELEARVLTLEDRLELREAHSAPLIGATVNAYLGGVLQGTAPTTAPNDVYEINADLPTGACTVTGSTTG
jgi:hypothetical protein